MTVRSWGSVALVCALIAAGCGEMGETNGGDDNTEPSAATPVNGYPTQPARIYVDEEGDDWTDLSVLYADGTEEAATTDLVRLWAAHTERHLFLRIELKQPLNLQEGNDITLRLDTDNDPTTGQSARGLGAELAWTFGDRAGQVVRTGETQEVEHADIGLTTLPTVQSETFEVALDRSATPGGSSSLLRGDSLRIALSADGDRLPDAEGGLGYVLSEADPGLDAPSIDRPSGSAVRMLSYNSVNNFDANRSAIFSDERQPSFRRIFDAVGPDVIAFQEVYDQSASEVDGIEEDLGLSDAWTWAKQGRDLVLGSRYPILDTHEIPGYDDYRSGAFLLDARDALGSKLLAINMHPPCCNYGPDGDEPSSNTQRQRVVDGVVAFLRDVKQGEGPFGLAPDTPIVVLGDMNFVGDAQQPRTLRTGDIVHNDRFGPDAAPDWDGSPLLDTKPQQVSAPMHTTWIDASSSFPPGRLDYAFVSDSVLDVVHEFVLHTPVLSEQTRSAYGLRAEDTNTASDHLPVVIDVA
ncbi:MAG: endonuclease/exonuclease/phosphatase family protein, partial [Salinibacter sp.]